MPSDWHLRVVFLFDFVSYFILFLFLLIFHFVIICKLCEFLWPISVFVRSFDLLTRFQRNCNSWLTCILWDTFSRLLPLLLLVPLLLLLLLLALSCSLGVLHLVYNCFFNYLYVSHAALTKWTQGSMIKLMNNEYCLCATFLIWALLHQSVSINESILTPMPW